MRKRRKRRSPFLASVVVALAAIAATVTTGCTSSKSGGPAQPPAARFAAGTCQRAAPAVLSVGRLIYDVRDRHAKPSSVAPEIGKAQQELRALARPSDKALGGRLQNLVTAIGFFRIGVDSNTFTPQRATNVDNAQQALVTFCTKAPGSGSS